ncbi:MAG: aminoglycoside phosphotransferase family protein [Candidatus Heimdallarchaeota archaeon]
MKIGKLIGRGRTADVFEMDDNKILKLYHENFPKRAVQSEYDTSNYIQDHLSIVPRVFDLIEYQGKNGIIFEKIEGIALLEYLVNNPFQIFKIAKQIAKLQVEIHNLEFKENDLQKSYFEYDIKNCKKIDEQTKEIILEMLDKLPADNKLCHRDFHPDNVMRSSKGLIVIDWMTATSGSPAGDVARSYYILKHGAPMDSVPFFEKIKIAIYRGVISRRYLREYLKLSKLKRKDIKKWEIVIITGRLNENIPQEHDYILKRIKKIIKTTF